jgi:hypothetical protein
LITKVNPGSFITKRLTIAGIGWKIIMRAWAGGPQEIASARTKTEQENERAALTALIDYVVETTCNSQESQDRDGADFMRRSLCESLLAG